PEHVQRHMPDASQDLCRITTINWACIFTLDVTMGEDACPIYRGDAAEILACIRHMALNMLRGETSRKASIRRKQKIAGMSSEYLEAVLTAGIQKLTAS
ncbi:transposase, partial [Aeromonas salmonicida]|uniref:transposase n=1 Tax=Aeromonas salmonicida TaxID=645 RepID=UPI003BF57BAC